jgi:hypothetical protein
MVYPAPPWGGTAGPRDFRLLWGSAAVSGLGSRVSLLAFPTIAVLVLHAGPFVDGARFVFGDRRLRRLAIASAVANLGAGIGMAWWPRRAPSPRARCRSAR